MSFSRFVGICTVLLVFSVLISTGALALTGPRLYIQEQVTGSYLYDGTVEADTARTGQVLISVPNSIDVLQYIRANLTGATEIARTDLQNSTAFRNVQYSPTANATAGIYVNTSYNDPDTSYSINSIDYGPTINLSMSWNNSRNGDDLFPDDNLEVGSGSNAQNIIMFNFSATNPSSVIDLNNSEVTIYFAIDYNGGRDVVNLTAGTNASSPGTTSLATADADNDWDNIVWTGNITAGSTIYFTVNGTIEEGDNFLASADTLDLDSTGDAGGNGNYSNSSTFTGITSDYRFARSSIRTGIDMSQGGGGYWEIRGFIRNVAATSSELSDETGLVYNVTEWRIYSVDPATGTPYSTANQSGEFNQTGTSHLLYPDDGRIYTNNATRSSNNSWLNSSASTKPYFSSYFDWHVVWDTDYSNTYISYVNTTMNLPDMYKVDLAHTKTHTDGYVSPDTGGESIWLNDNVTFAGDDNAAVRYFQINSVIPVNTTTNAFHGDFDINHTSVDDTPILLYFVNDSTHLMDITDSSFDVVVTDPASDGSANGTITITMGDVRNAALEAGGVLGDEFDGTEYFSLRYELISHASMTTGDTYNFTGNTSVATMSGTNYTQPHSTADVNIGGKRLTGYKELKVYDTSNPTLINATLLIEVESGGIGISGIKFMDYVPSSVTDYTNFVNNFSNGDFSVWFYDGSWNLWTYGTDYHITYNGTHSLNDGTQVYAFEFVNGSNETWTLNNGEKINVSYQMNVTTPGTYILPLELAGFDPETGQEFRAVTYGFIRVDIPEPDLPLHVTEGELAIAKRVVVGKPALWIKEFEVFNPNPRQISSRFETDVFVDAMEAYVSYYDDAGQKVERKVLFGPVSGGKKAVYWDDLMNALETRSYELRILTPPVMEIDRDVEVLEKLPDKRVKLKMDVYLKSFAEEDYTNVVLNLPISYEDVLEVRDGFGNRLEFTGGGESTTVFVNDIASGDIKTVTVIYRESYPTIIITPDRDRYNLNSPVGLEILVINGGETIEYPYIELEIYTPGMDVIFTNMEKLQTLEPLEKTEMFERFVVPASAPAGMYIASVKFREDFVTLASATGNFYIVGAGGGLPEALEILMILVVSGILLFFSFRRLKETRKSYSGSFERGGL